MTNRNEVTAPWRRCLQWRRCVAVHVLIALACGVGLAEAGDAPLVAAVKRRDIDAVRRLLTRSSDVNSAEGDRSTALHWAVHQNDAPAVDLLLRAGARVNAATDTGVTPLYLACTNRNAEMVQRLIEAKADVNAKLLQGETVLMECARTGQARAVELLIGAGADVNGSELAHDQTALMWAVANGHADTTRALIEGGADVRARSRVYAQIVARPSLTKPRGEDVVTEQRGGSTPLLFAARSGDVESAKYLLAAGADANDALPDGASALVVAAHSGHEAVATLLLEKGADPNSNVAGYGPLHAAVLRGNLSLVRALVAHGADPNLPLTRGTSLRRNSQDFELPAALLGATSYAVAAAFLEVEMMRVLAAAGADPRTPMGNGTTPLMAATGAGAPGQADRRGLAVLDGGHIPAEREVMPAVEAALALGSDVNATNRDGESALHSAATAGYDSIVRLLVERGADVNARNLRGQTPLAKLTGGGQRSGPNAFVNTYNQKDRTSTIRLLRELGAID